MKRDYDLPAEEENEETSVKRHDCEEWRCEGLGCQRCKRTVEIAEVEADLRSQRDAALSALLHARDALEHVIALYEDVDDTAATLDARHALATADRVLGESDGEGKG